MKTRNNRSRILMFVLVAFLCTNILSGTSQGLEILDDELVSKPQESSSITELKAYALPPIDLYPFVFSGSNPAVWLEMNTEDCVVGRLYIHDRRTNLLTPIGEDSVSVYASTKEHLYYVTNGRTLVETDYEGTSFTTLYQASRGDITYLYTFGRMIYLIEDGQYIVALDTETQSCETAMVQADVSTLFLFDTDKLIWYDSQRNPYYYNVTEQQSVALTDEAAVDELISPYMAAEIQSEQSTYSVNVMIDNQELYNNITIPLPEYPANLQYNFNTLTNVQSFYTGVGQCDGFAKYAHNRFWHLDSYGSGPSWNASSGDYHGASPSEILDDEYNPYTDTDIANIEKREDYYSFFANLDRGTFLRFVSKNDTTPYDGNHSIFFNGMTESGDGYYAYECNQKEENGRPNAVGYQIYQFDRMAGHYDLVLYYVEHILGTKSIQSTTRHKTSCTNCTGYLLQSHTGTASYRTASDLTHTVSFSCCSGTITQRHIIVSGSRDSCTLCGWVEGALIGSSPTPGLKE